MLGAHHDTAKWCGAWDKWVLFNGFSSYGWLAKRLARVTLVRLPRPTWVAAQPARASASAACFSFETLNQWGKRSWAGGGVQVENTFCSSGGGFFIFHISYFNNISVKNGNISSMTCFVWKPPISFFWKTIEYSSSNRTVNTFLLVHQNKTKTLKYRRTRSSGLRTWCHAKKNKARGSFHALILEIVTKKWSLNMWEMSERSSPFSLFFSPFKQKSTCCLFCLFVFFPFFSPLFFFSTSPTWVAF